MLTIVGPMRSGTSLAARLAAEAGVHMGTTMAMPWGKRRPEYEDMDLANYLHGSVERPDGYRVAYLLRSYAERRSLILERLQLEGEPLVGWGVKNPLLAVFWPAWEDALEALGEPLTVIRVTRHPKEIADTLERAAMNEAHHEQLKAQQERILAGIWENERLQHADLVIELGEMLECPEAIGGFLAGRSL